MAGNFGFLPASSFFFVSNSSYSFPLSLIYYSLCWHLVVLFIILVFSRKFSLLCWTVCCTFLSHSSPCPFRSIRFVSILLACVVFPPSVCVFVCMCVMSSVCCYSLFHPVFWFGSLFSSLFSHSPS